MIINLFAGPGCGKSTLALGVGHELKKRGYEAAVIIEEAKTWALAKVEITPAGQLEILYHQYRNEANYYNLADFIITDSPLELAGYYNYMRRGDHSYRQIVSQLRKGSPPRQNFFLKRTKPYEQRGRFQNEEEARIVDTNLRKYLAMQCCITPTFLRTHDPVEFIEEFLL